MTELIADLLEDLEKENKREQNKFLNLPHDEAMLLNILIRSCGSKRLLEVGTSNGYSTIWLAEAVQHNRGTITTIEINPWKADLARANLRKAELIQNVELICGDAIDVLPGLQGPFDFLFFDAAKNEYLDYFLLSFEKLLPRGIIAADNALSHKDEMASYLETVRRHPQLLSVLIPMGNGLEISLKVSR